MWRALLDAGLYANIVLPPACRADACLLRTSYSAAHTRRTDRSRARRSSQQVGRALVDHRRGGMKLVLINPRNRVSLYGDYLWQPLALGYVAAATPAHWDVELIDEQCEGALDYASVAGRSRRPDGLHDAGAARLPDRRAVPGARHPGRHGRHPRVARPGRSGAVRRRAVHRRMRDALAARCIADVEAGRLQPRYDGGTTGGALLHPGSAHLREVPLRVRLGADLARLPDGLLVLLGHRVQRPAVPHARGRRRRRRGRRDSRARHHLRGRRSERLLAQGEAALPRSLPGDGRGAPRQAVDHAGHDQLRRRRRAAAAGAGGRAAPACSSASRAPTPKSLALIRKDGMSQRRGLDYYRENVARIRRHGIGVVGSFILGIDTPEHGHDRVRHPAVRRGNRSRRPQPDDSDAAARHARLRALRRRGPHPVQELSRRTGRSTRSRSRSRACRT